MIRLSVDKLAILIVIPLLTFLTTFRILTWAQEMVDRELRILYQYLYVQLTICEDRNNFAEFVGEEKREKREEELDEILQHVPHID